LIMRYPEHMKTYRGSYQTEINDINSYKDRNKALDHIIEHTEDGFNSLVLVSRLEHLYEVVCYLEKKYKNHRIYEIHGDILPSRREEIRKKIELEGNVILVGTYATMSVGINIKKIHNVVFFSSYKSEVKVIQSIGRGLRKHDSKDCMVLWDCVDDLRYKEDRKTIKNYCYKHWEKRKEFYEEQQFEYSDSSINI